MTRAMQLAKTTGVKYEQGAWGDHFSGTTEALIAAGVITADQLPARSCVTYYKGVVAHGKRPTQDENFLRVYRTSAKRLCVTKGISSAEVERRKQERRERSKATMRRQQEEAGKRFNADPENLRSLIDMSLRMVERLIKENTPGLNDGQDGKLSKFACQFDAEGVDDALLHVTELQIWLESVRISEVRKPVQISVNAARADKAFQAFLQSQCLGGDA